MADTKFTNTGRSVGYTITEATPIDDRAFFSTLQDLKDLRTTSVAIFHDGLEVEVDETDLKYEWRESDYGIVTGETYVRGPLKGKTFNFIISSPKVYIDKVMNGTDTDISVSYVDLPRKIVENKFAEVTMRENSDSEITYPHEVQWNNSSIVIKLLPAPVAGTKYKIKIS